MSENSIPDGLTPMAELLYELRMIGYPISLHSVKAVCDYLIRNDLEPSEASADTIAQSIDQTHREIEVDIDKEPEIVQTTLPTSPYY